MTPIIWSVEVTGRREDLRTEFIAGWRLCLIDTGSGAAMIPCTMIKEADPDKVKGIAPGAINFLVFSFIILLASVSGVDLMLVFGGKTPNLVIFHEAELIWLCAIVTSLILTMFLRDAAAGARPRPESLAIRAL